MTPRLPSGMQVTAALRRVAQAGGSAMVLARGDADTGAVLAVVQDPGGRPAVLEREGGFVGDRLVTVGPDDGDEGAIAAYWMRRRAADRDLWVIELIVADARRLVAEVLLAN